MQGYFLKDSLDNFLGQARYILFLGRAGEVGPSLQTHWGLRTAYLESTTQAEEIFGKLFFNAEGP